MILEEALQRLQVIINEVENKQLPLNEVVKLHKEGQSLVSYSEKLLSEAEEQLKVEQVEVDSVEGNTNGDFSNTETDSDISLF